MKLTASKEIRQAFLEYFKDKGHRIVPSSSLVPQEDPTLLFTNAGMVQFKKVFLGEEKREYKRAASCQKCVRAGGKHNDLENVGYTARHHTFFEMLGNFSFGDYFKKEAIEFAWEFLVEYIGLPRERLYVTVFREDQEARELWTRLTGIEPERVIGLGEKDNFWQMGDTGPCGPCSEILIDQGEGVGCGRPDCRPGCDCDRFLELWNLVFMQFFRDEKGDLHPLPRPSIDTGMGLERISAICQGKLNNFDTDLFSGIIHSIEALSKKQYGEDKTTDVAIRVIADHARASAFLIADGIVPSNEGRGFVLRRIIRRAARFGKTLGLNGPFLKEVCEAVKDTMGDVYPELIDASVFTGKIVESEEERFLKTLDFGLEMLEEEIEDLRARNDKCISGHFAFKLYDTYGLPIDIVQDISKEHGLEVDRTGFEKEMEEQRKRSKASRKGQLQRELPPSFQRLVDKEQGGEFIGYESLETDARCLAIFGGTSKDPLRWQECNTAKGPGWFGEALFSKTPFYPESGGQVGDTGEISGPGLVCKVHGTIRRGNLICHQIEVIEGTLIVGEHYRLRVHEGARADTARNHTATHLLHAALRSILGPHVKQSGSLVSRERLRFDFTHFKGISSSQLHEIEAAVNQAIRENAPVNTQITTYDQAVALGAMALFGEKYGERVRIVEVPGVSMELCGGTHVDRTGTIGLFKIVNETSVAAGIRRIEAVTGRAAISYIHRLEDSLESIAHTLKCPREDIQEKVQHLIQRLKDLTKEVEELKLKGGGVDVSSMLSRAQSVQGVKLVCQRLDGMDPKILRELGDRIKDRLKSGVVILAGEDKGKALILVMVTKDLTDRLNAGDLIRELAKYVNGGGGGRPDMAQAGGSDPRGIDKALQKAPGIVERALAG